MAMLQPLMQYTGIGKSSYSLTPKVGQSILVTGIECTNVTDDYLVITTNKTTVGYYSLGNFIGNHLHYADPTNLHNNILRTMIEEGIMKGYPVADGETIVFSTLNGGTFDISVTYEIYDSSDIKSTDPNGSASAEYTFVNYGEASDVATKLQAAYDTALDPTEFPGFPFNEIVPSKQEIEVHAIAGAPVAVTAATTLDQQKTTYVKLIKDRVVYFDEDKNGLTFLATNGSATTAGTYIGGISKIGANSDVYSLPALRFSEPLTFKSGDEVNMYLLSEIVSGSATLTPSNTQIALVETVKPSSGT